MSSATAVVPQVAAPLHATAVSHGPYLHTWCALQRNPCRTSLGRRKKRLELGLNHESGPIGAPVRWAPDASPMGVIGPHRAPSNSRSDGLLCQMRADAARCTILAEADDGDGLGCPTTHGTDGFTEGNDCALVRCVTMANSRIPAGAKWLTMPPANHFYSQRCRRWDAARQA